MAASKESLRGSGKRAARSVADAADQIRSEAADAGMALSLIAASLAAIAVMVTIGVVVYVARR